MEEFGTGDPRQLGVQVTGVRLDGVVVPIVDAPRGVTVSSSRAYLRSYGRVGSNSEFTRGWVRRWWGLETELLYPPVQLRTPGEKRSHIVSVGRFFGSSRGHSKKQLEMIEAFRLLHASGRAVGWELHLIGGCSKEDRDYGVAARKASVGLPVVIHFNASGAELNAVLAGASIYWHAAGMGEDHERHPVRMEHFGIAVVEAMSAGAVPVVYAQAGPAEIVCNGIDGLHVHNVEELATVTAGLIGDDQRRVAFAAAARRRSEDFSFPAFARRLNALIDSY
jgi:glycosyltransferase involved in cell wall biosynthesis